MKFPDDDLEWLKEQVMADVESSGIPMTRSYMNRLLARLEAAENIIKKILEAKTHAGCELRASDLYIEDWHKAAGKWSRENDL